MANKNIRVNVSQNFLSKANQRFPKSSIGVNQSFNLKIPLTQTYDTLDILSLSIDNNTLDSYRRDCSNIGLIVGRVRANGGVGVPNVRVGIFLPLLDEDVNNNDIRSLYNYSNVYDSNRDGIQFNLLRNDQKSTDTCHTPIGTFPNKNQILDNPRLKKVYDKYFKYTTVTNQSGDFMIYVNLDDFPNGTANIVMNVDYSDIGDLLSMKPYHFIEQGTPEGYFDSTTKFSFSKTLNTLPQFEQQVQTIDILPLYCGDDGNDLQDYGIKLVNFNLNKTLQCYSYYACSMVYDGKKRLSKKGNFTNKSMLFKNLETSNVRVQIARRVPQVSLADGGIEILNVNGFDEDGILTTLIPLNDKYKVTDESGNLIDAIIQDGSVGIATSAKVRIKFYTSEIQLRRSHKLPDIVTPHQYNSLKFISQLEEDYKEINCGQLYTSSFYIPKISDKRGNTSRLDSFGIKDIEDNSSVNPMPYTNIYFKGGFGVTAIFAIICNLLEAYRVILGAISLFNGIDVTCDGTVFEIPALFGQNRRDIINDYIDCLKTVVADALNIRRFVFENNWLTGCVPLLPFKFKIKFRNDGTVRKIKFFDYECGQTINGVQRINCPTQNDYIRVQTGYNNTEVVNTLAKQGFIYYNTDENSFYLLAHSNNNLDTKINITDKKDLLFHNSIVRVGYVGNNDCDPISKERNIFEQLPITSYDEPTSNEVLHDIRCFIDDGDQLQNNIQRVNTATICQIGVNNLENDRSTINTSIINDVEDRELLRKNISTSLCYYDNILTYESSTLNTITYIDEDTEITTDDYILDKVILNGNKNVVTTNFTAIDIDNVQKQSSTIYNDVNNLYFYSGLTDSWVERLREKYFNKCD